ncbi:hypothetical protein DENIS_2656 [Desulfonema ishimotonii]|uniref:Uncharacterized protein n=1 Tax=Desulfonema ishimotonii TaxID=45657 RepID=A0A401FXN0_9BACT|nr:hypothetical protein [Desulfonema ishimotonii]GBC61694.1 hypothetical protein DENIS_2656 [Desulfonema ishimotonii]
MEKKDKPRGSGKSGGSMLMVIVLLWLVLLTGLGAFFVMIVNNPKEEDLETRLAKLEGRSSKVVRKIKPAAGVGDDAFKSLDARLSKLENAQGATVTAADSAGAGACNCDDLVSRLEKLEAAMVAKKDESPKPVARAAVPVKKQKKVRPRRRKKTIARRSSPKASVSAPAPVVAQKAAEPAARSTLRYEDTYGRESVYDMTRRLAPRYTYTGQEMDSLSTLAPGAAIYPDSGSSYVSRTLGN